MALAYLSSWEVEESQARRRRLSLMLGLGWELGPNLVFLSLSLSLFVPFSFFLPAFIQEEKGKRHGHLPTFLLEMG